MFLASGRTKTGGKVLAVGLTSENFDRLDAGHPISKHLAELGLGDLELMIFYGESESNMLALAQEAGLIGPKTEVAIRSAARRGEPRCHAL